MLVLSRMAQEGKDTILVGRGTPQELVIRVLKIKGSQVSIGIDTAGEINVVREEILTR